MLDAQTKGLFRTVLAGPGGTIREVVQTLAVAPGPHPRQVNARWNTACTRIDLPADEGSGCWQILSISDELFLIVTKCHYTTTRFETVPAEGLVEFHYVLEGPVALDLPRPGEPLLNATSIMACHQARGVSYDVGCLPGTFRMISLYVRPSLLEDSFGFGQREGSPAALLMNPPARSMALVDTTSTVEISTVLRALFQLPFAERRDLMLAVGKVFELLTLTTELLDAPQHTSTGISFTERELSMFARAREILAGDDGGQLTIAGLARQLGTNSTKLKSGFKLLYGLTVFDYRHRSRMARALELLANPETQIATIAARLGYRHQASFTTAFKRHFGLSPKDARKLGPRGLPPGEG